MRCQCGKDGELQQMNIFGEEEPICRDCFNMLGHHKPEPEYEEGLFYASQMGGSE